MGWWLSYSRRARTWMTVLVMSLVIACAVGGGVGGALVVKSASNARSGNTTTTHTEMGGSEEGSPTGGNSTIPDGGGSGNSTDPTPPGENTGAGGFPNTPICRASQCQTGSDCGRSSNPFSSRRCRQGIRINGRQCGRVCTGI